MDEELVWRGIEAFNSRDVERFLEFVDPGIVFETLTLGVSHEGHGGVRQYFQEWVVEPWERFQLEAVSIEIAGETRALVEMRLRASARRTGIETEMHYWDVLEGIDGRLLRRAVYTDEAAARAALHAESRS